MITIGASDFYPFHLSPLPLYRHRFDLLLIQGSEILRGDHLFVRFISETTFQWPSAFPATKGKQKKEAEQKQFQQKIGRRGFLQKRPNFHRT